MKVDLAGKIALVTGSSSEIGRVICVTLAECGAEIALHYHQNRERAEIVRKQITSLGRKATTVQGDITNRDSILKMREQIEIEIGSPDIVVTNAISGSQWRPVLEQSPEDYATQFASTAIQNVLMAQVFVPAMIRKHWGRIIAISTECVMQGNPGQSAYVAGKRGMDGVLRVLAREIGEHQITVNQVAPGWTISERDRLAGTEKQEDYDKNVPLRRRNEDRDVANAVAFFASDLAKSVTGVFLPVCGGNIMPSI